MSIKVFFRVPTINGYVGNPATAFRFTVAYDVCQSDGGEDNGPRSFQEEAFIEQPLTDGPEEVFAAALAAVVTRCGELGYDTPTTADVYLYPPMLMSTL